MGGGSERGVGREGRREGVREGGRDGGRVSCCMAGSVAMETDRE